MQVRHLSSPFFNRILTKRFRFPCQKTIVLLLKCGARVDAFDNQRNTPLHLITQRKEEKEMENILSIVNLLCDFGQAHVDCVNNQNQTPLDLVVLSAVKDRLKQKFNVNRLKCLCARRIREEKLQIKEISYPNSLKDFIQIH